MHDIVAQRLRLFLAKENITYKKLSDMILMPETRLSRKLTGTRSLDLHTLVSITVCFPEISADWLLRGRGEMLILPSCDDSHSSENGLIRELETEREILKRENRILREMLELRIKGEIKSDIDGVR